MAPTGAMMPIKPEPPMEFPAKPEVLRWARGFHALNPRVAAAKLGITEAELEEVEKGHKRPTLTLLRNMSAQYGLPLATLLRRTPPATPKLPNDYRTLGSETTTLDPETVAVIRIAQYQQAEVAELLEEHPTLWSNLPLLRRVTRQGSPEAAGDRERQELGITVQDQLGWRGYEEAFRELRERLHESGVLVFVMDMPVAACRGFSLLDESPTSLPVVVVNKADTYSAKVFTLFHEYAHLLLRQAGVCDEFAAGGGGRGIETYCNRFAAALLMPRATVESLRPAGAAGNAHWTLDEVSVVARRLKVSRQALALRLIQLGLADSDLYRQAAAAAESALTREKETVDEAHEGYPPFHIQRLHAVGKRYARIVISAWQQDFIDMARANRLLGTQEKSLRSLAAHLDG